MPHRAPEDKGPLSKEQALAPWPPLEAFLLRSGILTLDQLTLLQESAQSLGHSIGAEILARGLVSPVLLAAFQVQALGIEPVCMEEWVLDPVLNAKLPINLRNQGVALLREGEVVLAYPEDLSLRDHVQKYVSVERIFSASLSSIQEALLKCFGSSLEEQIGGLDQNPEGVDVAALVDQILLESLKQRASDIHFQPEEGWIRLQLRIDGELETIRLFSRKGWDRVLARLKVMGQLDLAQRLKPQSGRFSRRILGRGVDFRLSLHPTLWGENCVIRILDKEQGIRTLEDLGFTPQISQVLETFLSNPQGLFIVTGPTGSGKTTTLYAMLQRLARPGVNIMTLEDPIEYVLSTVRQTEIGGHVSYAEGIRSILRQDPDILLVGEIRDEETAQMAFRAALTGHSVLTTLHAASPLGVIDRLKDLKVSIGQMSGFLKGILSQRLVRVECKTCAGRGCVACRSTGYKGRCAEGEVIQMTSTLQQNLKRSLPELEEIWKAELRGKKF